MILWLILLTSRYDFFEINRSLSGDVILGEDIAKYCTNGGTDPCHCPEERPTFTGDLYSPTCADSQTIGKWFENIGHHDTGCPVKKGKPTWGIPIYGKIKRNKLMWQITFYIVIIIILLLIIKP